MKNIPIFVVLISTTSACTTISQPDYKPLTYGIIDNHSIQQSTKKVPSGSNKNLAIILSDNTKLHIEYSNKVMQSIGDSSIQESENPEFSSKYIINTLKKNFEKVSLINNLSQFNNGSYTNMVIIDIYSRGDNGWGYFDSSYSVATAFYDKNNNYINIAKSSIKETIPHDSIGGAGSSSIKVHQLRQKVLNLWEADLIKIIEPSIPIAPKFNYDNCIRQAISVTDMTLKSQAMDFCEQQKKAAR